MDPQKTLQEILDLLDNLCYNREHNEAIREEIEEHLQNYSEWLEKGGFSADLINECRKWVFDKNVERRFS